MSLRVRMSAIVGDENTVARYLTEKVGHTALLTIGLHTVLPLLTASLAATLGYVLVGKWWWHRTHGGWSWKDLIFDTLVGSLVVALALCVDRPAPGALAVLAWAALFLVLDNAAWGSPS